MTDNKPFAMFFNASPRKGWNTHKMLEAAKAGAEEAGALLNAQQRIDSQIVEFNA
jgi:multimeric flavodoxin WrbA